VKLVAVDKTDELHEPMLFQPQPSPDDDYKTTVISECERNNVSRLKRNQQPAHSYSALSSYTHV